MTIYVTIIIVAIIIAICFITDTIFSYKKVKSKKCIDVYNALDRIDLRTKNAVENMCKNIKVNTEILNRVTDLLNKED